MVYCVGQWLYLKTSQLDCLVLSTSTLWDKKQYEVFIPDINCTRFVEEDELEPISESQDISLEPYKLSYICAAIKIKQLFSDFAEKKAIVSPARSEVIPLPHQIEALKKVMGSNPIRFLLADEVGLGKTIEAGLIIEEMKLRYHIKRILIVVPKGLSLQWVSEMKLHFAEDFKLINGNEIESLDRLFVSEGGAWKQFDQVIITHDSVKPLAHRRGWTKEKVDAYNTQRLGNLLKAGWDLIIVDEAHRFGGTTEQVARYKLGKNLSDNAPNLLLLSATPHQGKSDAFFRLMNILDERAFPEEDSISKESVSPFLVRTEKRKAIDANGERLFKDRITSTIPVEWGPNHNNHQLLYEQVSEYARTGYNKAVKSKKPQMSFLMILLQRLVSSSTSAIRNTLERRLTVLKTLTKEDNLQNNLPALDDLEEMDGEEQQEALIESSSDILSEISEVEELLELAKQCENSSDDAKTIAFINLVAKLMDEEKDYNLKILVFTEFVATQEMLAEKLEKRNFDVERINGSMSSDDRKDAMKRFEESSNFLVSTDAGGEGLNLQFAHVIINYDLPWNPMKIEQRIGRVDRIGQLKTVRVFNLLLNSSVEFRIRQVIEEKLRVIAEELGINKTSDVLESSNNGKTFEKALADSIMNPESADKFVNLAMSDIKAELKSEHKMAEILSSSSNEPHKESVKEVTDNPLASVTERMVSQYILANGGSVEKKNGKWIFRMKDGKCQKDICFDPHVRGVYKSTKDAEIINILDSVRLFRKGMRVSRVTMPGLPVGVSGTWGLFCLEIRNGLSNIHKEYLQLEEESKYYFPVFLSSSGKVFKPTATRIWDLINKSEITVSGYFSEEESLLIENQIEETAVKIAKELLEDYQVKQEMLINKERQRLVNYNVYQENNIRKTGLDNVRQFRQHKLGLYNDAIDNEIKAYKKCSPELKCYAVISMEESI